MKYFFRIIGLSFVPTFLTLIGKNDFLFNLFAKANIITDPSKIPKYQFYSFTIGLIWAGVITPLQLAIAKKKLKDKSLLFEQLLSFNKETYFKSVKNAINKHNADFKTRIFVKQKNFKAIWNEIWNDKITLSIKNFKGITDEINARVLCFEAKPSSQGLVGKTFVSKNITIDCNVSPDNYNLTYYQRSKTNDVKFCTASPIFNEKNDVIAVLSIDSNDDLSFSEKELEEWKGHVIYYCAFVDKHLKF